MKAIPSSVYRLQMNEHCSLKRVLDLLPYFDSLGIEGIYCSPIFEANSSGYDIVNPNRINPALGNMDDLNALCTQLEQRGMKLILDVVPNHMGIKGQKNQWWLDVLENGPQSAYSDFFDIDWYPLKDELKNKILLPILGESYGRSLLNQEILLIWEEGFWIQYDGYKLPLAPATYSFVLEDAKEISSEYSEDSEWNACLNLAKNLSNYSETKKELQILYDRSNRVRSCFDQLLTHFNGKKGDHHSFDSLHELLECQFFRLAHWRVAGQEVNYRRFFNISELIAIHIENERVLNTHHNLVFKLIDEGKVQGLRIDHPDGLYDPVLYFQRLQAHHPSFIVVEKILDSDESLPQNWDVSGTVGYEFLNILSGLFVQKNGEHHLTKIYDHFIGHKTDFDHLLYECKKQYVSRHMGGEINTLGLRLDRFSNSNRYYRDYTRVDLIHAIREIIACFPVYRTYIRFGEEVSRRDKDYIIQAVESAKIKTPEIDALLYDYIRDIFLGIIASPNASAPTGIDFILRLQQHTPQAMAKGLEDSAFYIFNRLVALNEVGGNPKQFGKTKADFHQFNSEKLLHHSLGFLPSSTHDTKWSEDVRLRLSVLSEIPDKWEQHVKAWREYNQPFKKKIRGAFFPDPNTEYYLYQMLLGVWPDHPAEASFSFFEQTISRNLGSVPSEAIHANTFQNPYLAKNPEAIDGRVLQRIKECFLKSMREAGIYTSWHFPNQEYEEAAKEFLHHLLTPHETNRFYPTFLTLQREIASYGRWNSLAALVLKIGSCGIVDIYQGNEWWNYSLMDPDNRRPINYDFLQDALHTNRGQEALKLQITRISLQFRRQHKNLFLKGKYIPLTVQKELGENVIAFLRQTEDQCVLIAAGRFFTQLPESPIGQATWKETFLVFPKDLEMKEFRNIFTDKRISSQKKKEKRILRMAEIFEDFPFAILEAI